MKAPGSSRFRLLGGLAGVLIGAALVAAWIMAPGMTLPHFDSTDAVGVLAGGAPAGGGGAPMKLGEKADALSGVIEVRLRAKEFDKALDLLRRADGLKAGERDQVYERAANALLKPAMAGGDEKEREGYLMDNGGKPAVLERLPSLYAIVRQMPESPMKVALLLRVRNVREIVGEGKGDPAIATRLAALPAAESLMGEASRIARALPTESSPWILWAVGGFFTVVLGFLGLVISEMILECARCMAQEISRDFGLGRFKKPEAAKAAGMAAVGNDRPAPAPELVASGRPA